MAGGAWQATAHGVTRVRHDLATKPPPPVPSQESHPHELITSQRPYLLQLSTLDVRLSTDEF